MDEITLKRGTEIQSKIRDLDSILNVLEMEMNRKMEPIELLVEFLTRMNNVSGTMKKKELAADCLKMIIEKCRNEKGELQKEFRAL